jgi:hypothetical protein
MKFVGMKFKFRLVDWCLWSDEGNQVASLTGVSNDPAFELPKMLRRRLGKQPLKGAQAACQLPGVEDATYVVCSRHGDLRRTLKLLKALSADDDLSPTDFSLAVHNMLAGILSIATDNQQGHTAIAAGVDTFGFGVLECLTRLQDDPDTPVLLIVVDEPLPEEYGELAFVPEQSIALAMMLVSPTNSLGGGLYSAEMMPGTTGALGSMSQVEDFIHFLNEKGAEGNTDGQRMGWRWERHV